MARKKISLTNDVNFLYEIGSLRFIQRTWRQFMRADVANNAEHTFRVIWTALTIARHEEVKDEEKIMKFALIHDIGESRCLDTNYLSKLYSSRDEEKAIRDMTEDTVMAEDILNLFKEYQKRDTIEAKIVKDADMLDVDFELQEMLESGNRLKERWSRKNAREMLYTRTAKKIWDELLEIHPNEWHSNAHNKYKKKSERLT